MCWALGIQWRRQSNPCPGTWLVGAAAVKGSPGFCEHKKMRWTSGWEDRGGFLEEMAFEPIYKIRVRVTEATPGL